MKEDIIVIDQIESFSEIHILNLLSQLIAIVAKNAATQYLPLVAKILYV
jgi:hypothetical protein